MPHCILSARGESRLSSVGYASAQAAAKVLDGLLKARKARSRLIRIKVPSSKRLVLSNPLFLDSTEGDFLW